MGLHLRSVSDDEPPAPVPDAGAMGGGAVREDAFWSHDVDGRRGRRCEVLRGGPSGGN